MKRVFRLLLGALLVLVLAPGTVRAQATAQINGIVADSSGGVLPGVTVIAIQTDTGFRREVVSDEAGAYALLNLPIGPYRLEASLAGFRTYSQTGVVLQVNANPVIPVTMQLGSLEETVSVEASAPLVETRNPAIGAVIENEAVEALPLEGRNPVMLVMMAGAAADTGAPTSRSMTTSRGIAITGGQPFGVAYLLDGASHNNVLDGLNLPLPFPDALQEFRVETSSQNAANGRQGSGTVSLVTKAGTNLYRGDLFEFYRHHRFNSTSPFAAVNPATGERRSDGLVRNQFGGTIGGPIARDRLFFFFAYQGTRATQTPADIVTFIPTAAMLAGDFSTVASSQCRAQGNLTLPAAAGFANNRISPAQLSPAALKIAAAAAHHDRPVRADLILAKDPAARGAADRARRLADQPEPVAFRPLHADDDLLGSGAGEQRQHPVGVRAGCRRPRQLVPVAGDWRHDGVEQHGRQQHPVRRQPHQRAPDARRHVRPRGCGREHLHPHSGIHAPQRDGGVRD